MSSEDEIDYFGLAQDALRGIVRSVLQIVVNNNGELPGDHHFFIAFDTRADDVVMSQRLREQYPKEMTVVLQHRFWDLQVFEDRFQVQLTFNNLPERLVIPFSAIKGFFDPSAQFALPLEQNDIVLEAAPEGDGAPAPQDGNVATLPNSGPLSAPQNQDESSQESPGEAKEPSSSDDEAAAKDGDSSVVVELDAFRKK